MKSLTAQLAFARSVQTRMQKGHAEHVRTGRMTNERAQDELECQASIVATLERAKLLEEVSEEMKGMVGA